MASRRFTGASILRITYGYVVEREDNELVQLVDRAVEEFSLASAPGAHYADVLPMRSSFDWPAAMSVALTVCQLQTFLHGFLVQAGNVGRWLGVWTLRACATPPLSSRNVKW